MTLRDFVFYLLGAFFGGFMGALLEDVFKRII